MDPSHLLQSPTFHGLPIERRRLRFGPDDYEVLVLKDAADLLDIPEFGKRFIEGNVAPYGLELWPGAIMLADFVVRDEPGQGREAIEIGCGLGLLALVATRRGWKVSATDNDENALQFAACNAGLNRIDVHKFEVLDWNFPPPAPVFLRVYGADVLYQLEDHPQILECVRKLLAPGGSAYFADPFRGVADRFPGLAAKSGYNVEVLPGLARTDETRQIKGRIFKLSFA